MAITSDSRPSEFPAIASRGRVPLRSPRRSRSVRTAGTKVSIIANAATMPTAARMPKSRMAGIGLLTFVRNPSAVVIVARTRATPTVWTALPTAWSTVRPPDTSSR